MTDEQLVQLERVLESRFFGSILARTDSSTRGWTAEQHRIDRLSRSLASFAICKLAGINEADACHSVIDGHDDNGIDALYFNETANELVLVQSKFKKGAEPDLGETLKFTKGIRNLFDYQFDRFNQAFQLKLPAIQPALEKPDLSVRIVLAHVGGTLGRHSQDDINDLLEHLNRYQNGSNFENMSGDKIFAFLTDEHSSSSINQIVELQNWAMSSSTPRVLYGQISAAQLAQMFDQHGKDVFARNIRNYIGLSEVNKAIEQTVIEEPDLLMHLNNGLTIICRSFSPHGPVRHDRQKFTLTGFSVVNGAQTVGSIARASGGSDLTQSPAKVLVTVIEADGATANFEQRVTETRNTQNPIRVSDFASQDLNQERLRRELAISGVAYHYKAGEVRPAPSADSVTLEEAATALACFSGNIDDIVTLRRSLPQVVNPESETYNRLFTDTLTGAKLYRRVLVYRVLNKIADEATSASAAGSRGREFYRNMRWFVMHFLKRKFASVIDRASLELSKDDELSLSREFNEVSEQILEMGNIYMDEEQSGRGYLWLSGNLTAVKQLASRVQEALNPTPKPTTAPETESPQE